VTGGQSQPAPADWPRGLVGVSRCRDNTQRAIGRLSTFHRRPGVLLAQPRQPGVLVLARVPFPFPGRRQLVFTRLPGGPPRWRPAPGPSARPACPACRAIRATPCR